MVSGQRVDRIPFVLSLTVRTAVASALMSSINLLPPVQKERNFEPYFQQKSV